MPQAVFAAAAATAATAGGAIIAGVVVTQTMLISTFVSTLILSAMTSAITKKAKRGQIESRDRMVTIRQPAASWKIIYGKTRVDGVITFADVTQENNNLHLVITLACHEVEAIGDIYFGDEVVPLDAAGTATGRYAGKVTIKKGLGTTAGDAALNTALTSEVGSRWTASHKQAGHAKIYVKLTWSNSLFPTGLPNITAIVKGKKVYDPRTGTSQYSSNAALCLVDYLTNSEYGLGVDYATEVNEAQLVAEANTCEESVDVTETGDTFTASAATDTLTFAGGAFTGMRDGDGVELTTTGTLPAGLSPGTTYYAIKVAADQVQLASSVAGVFSGTAVDVTDAGSGTHTLTRVSELRYLANGLATSDLSHKTIIQSLLGAMHGRAAWISGEWFVHAGAWITPTVTLDEDDVDGPIQVQTRIPRREVFNSVKGVFPSEDDLYQPADFPPLESTTFQTEDSGEKLWRDFDFGWTTSPSAAQRIAKIHLLRARQQITVRVPLKLTAYRVKVGDTVYFDNARFGWSSKPFEVVEWVFEVREDRDGAPYFGVIALLRESDATVYDWSTSEEQVYDPAPNTSLPDAWTVASPVNLSLESGSSALFVQTDGTVVSQIIATWDAVTAGLLSGIEVQWKKASESVWNGAKIHHEATQYDIRPVADGVDYDVRVRAINVLGVPSPWETFTNYKVVGKSDPPSAPTSFTVSQQADGTRRYSWAHDTVPADVRSGGGYKIRYYLGTTSTWEDMTPLHTGVLSASPHESNELAAGTYTLAIKAVDSSGNESSAALFQSSVALGDPRIANALVQRNERTEGFPGTKTDCWVTRTGVLRANSAAVWNDLTNPWNTYTGPWYEIGTISDPIEYTTPTIDVGQDLTFRPLVTVAGRGAATITMQVGTDADGAPTGSFLPLATVTARYIKIRVSVTDATAAYISTMVTVLDAPSKVEIYEDIITSTAADAWFESIAAGHFRVATRGGLAAISSARISALQNVGGGWTWELITKTATHSVSGNLAAEFKVYNSSATLADATVDVELRGPKAS